MNFTSSIEQTFVHKHKLPPRLLELLQSSERSSLVGFGATQEQRDFMLVSALLNNQDTDFFQQLKQELDKYFLTLSYSLSASLTP